MAFNPGGSGGISTAADVALSSMAQNDVLTTTAVRQSGAISLRPQGDQ